MPGNFLQFDTGFPQESGNLKEDVSGMRNYLYMLLEQLRYTLGNLSQDNFNETDFSKIIDQIKAKLITTETIISNTVITNELYASFGSIADLTVDKLRTDWKRAKNYLTGDTSAIDYISIHDEEITFITATTDGTAKEQLTNGTRLFYWTSADHTQMTCAKKTDWPVYVYKYNELVKGSFHFGRITLQDETITAMPVLELGAGTGDGSVGKATIKKREDGLDITYKATNGETGGIYLRDDGFVDATHRRASVEINVLEGKLNVTPEGVEGAPYTIRYAEDATTGALTLTWPDEHVETVTVIGGTP